MCHSIELPDPKPDWINLSAQTMAFAASKCPEQQCSHEIILCLQPAFQTQVHRGNSVNLKFPRLCR